VPFIESLVIAQIRAGHISQSRADKNVRRKMFLCRIARETYAGCKRVSAPFKSSIMRITARHNRSEGKTCGRVSRRERPSAGPEFSCAIPCGGKFAIKRQLKAQAHRRWRIARTVRQDARASAISYVGSPTRWSQVPKEVVTGRVGHPLRSRPSVRFRQTLTPSHQLVLLPPY
jgi:hypothetical protein